MAAGAVSVQGAFDLGQLLVRHPSQLQPQLAHRRTGQVVADVLAFANGRNQPGLFEALQMLGGVGDAHVGFPGQLLNRARGLGQQIQQFQPVGVGQGAGKPGK